MPSNIHRLVGESPQDLWIRCGGVYVCPRDETTRQHLGPLVGYAGKYKDAGIEKAFVGDDYYNFAWVEQHPHALDFFAKTLAKKLKKSTIKITVVLGAPVGGMLLASALARRLDCRSIFAEKKIITLETETQREESILVLDRHQLESDDLILIVEDVCNNFSTIRKLWDLCRAPVVGIACALNRSYDTCWTALSSSFGAPLLQLPVFSVLHFPLAQYTQEDPRVSSHVLEGNVIWKPKNQWAHLQEVMTKHVQ